MVKGNKSIFALLTHKKNLNASLNTYGGVNIEIDATVELGRNYVSKHRIQPEYGD